MDEKLIGANEALKVGPDEVLILRVPESWFVGLDVDDPDPTQLLVEHLERIGLKDRCLVIQADDIQFVAVAK